MTVSHRVALTPSTSRPSFFGRIISSQAASRYASALALISTLAAGVAQAQAPEVSFYDEQGKLLRGSETAGTLGPDLFGDQISLYTGSVEFVQTDVSIPGNSALPVSVGRRYRIGQNHQPQGHFSDWDLEVPRAHGVFAADIGWAVDGGGGRCSNFGVPPTAQVGMAGGGSYLVEAEAYWQGNFIYLPGSGDHEILKRAPGNAPPSNVNSNSYTLTTKAGGMIRCIGSGADEGFELLTPDGTTYRFDHRIQREASRMSGGSGLVARPAGESRGEPLPSRGSNGSLHRVEVWIVPTLVTDRYGNTVTYTWSGSRLLRIEGSDGRLLTFTYPTSGHQIQTVTAQPGGDEAARTWSYQYQNQTAAGQTFPGLKYVNLPGGLGAWTFNLAQFMFQVPTEPLASKCTYAQPGVGDVAGSMTHPGGTTGTFTLERLEHGRTWVDFNCTSPPGLPDNSDGSWTLQPRQFGEWSLIQKHLSGPGLPGYTWNYVYNEGLSTSSYCWNPATAGSFSPVCTTSSPTTKTVRVTDPQGYQTRYTFGIRSKQNEGQLLKVESGWNGSSAQRTVTTTYAAPSSPPWPLPLGASIQQRGDAFMGERLFPESGRTTVQDGVTFNWTVGSFDARGRPLAVGKSSALGSKAETTAYHDNTNKWVLGQVERVIVQYSGQTWYPVVNTYDAATANLLTHSRYGKLHRSYQWYGNGTLSKSMDARGSGFTSYTTEYGTYKRGVPTSITYANGDWLTASINDTGEIRSVTQAALPEFASLATEYQYDQLGRLKRVDYPGSGWNPLVIGYQWTSTSEMGTSHWLQTTSQGNARTLTYYDALWRPALTKRYDFGNESETRRMTLTQYDSDGRVTYQSYPQRSIAQITPPTSALPAGTKTTYDALGQLKTTKADSELGELETVVTYLSGFRKQVRNPRLFTTVTSYQAFDEPVKDTPMKVVLADEGEITYTRDVLGKPLTLTQSGSGGAAPTATRSYAYDTYERLCKTVEPESGATLQGYDLADNVTWRATGQSGALACGGAVAAQRATMTYDGRNRLLSTSYADGVTQGTTQTWTQDGKLKTATSFGSTWTYNYNARRLLESETLTYAGTNYAFIYQHDANGSVTQLKYPDDSLVNYAPNALGEPTYVSGYATQIKFHPNGGLYKFNYANGIQHETLQNIRGLPRWSADTGVIDDTYSYDENGNVTAISDMLSASNAFGPNLSRTMAYDSRDRLKVGHFNDLSIPDNMSERGVTFTYDELDNVLTNVTGLRDFTYHYNSNQQLTKITNAVTPYSYIDYAYDVRGNMTSRSVVDPVTPANSHARTFTFDKANRMTAATVPPPGSGGASAGTTNYGYDGNGRRVAITPPGGVTKLQMYSQGGQFLSEIRTNGSGRVNYVYLGRHLLARVPTNSLGGGGGGLGTAPPKFFQHTDGLGSPIGVTDLSGVLQGRRIVYEPYGDQAMSNEGDGPAYTGHVSDAMTTLTYMQARYYDPVASRFLSVDPVAASAESVNRYWYANNNPYKYVDPDGRFGVVGAFIGALVEVGVQVAVHGEVNNWAAVGVAGAVGAVTGGVGGLLGKAAVRGAVSTSEAVYATAAVGGATNAWGKVAESGLTGESISSTDVALAAAGGSLGAGAGEKIGLATVAKLENMAASGGMAGTISSTTQAAVRQGGPIVEPATTATQKAGQLAADAGAVYVQERAKD